LSVISLSVVVREDHRRRIVMQRFFRHFSGVYRSAVDCAPEQFVQLDYPVLIVEKQAGEDFVAVASELRAQIGAGRIGTGQGIAALQDLLEMAPRHFHHRLHLRVLGVAETVAAAETLPVGIEQRFQRTEVVQQVPGQVDRAFARRAGAQKNGQKLGVGQRRHPPLQQFFSWPVLFGPVFDGHRQYSGMKRSF
jgi:hypothetical protein